MWDKSEWLIDSDYFCVSDFKQIFLVFQDVLKTLFSVTIFGLSRCLQEFFARRLQAVFKTSSRFLLRRLLQVVLRTSLRWRLAIMPWRRLWRQKNVTVKTSWRRLHLDKCLIDLTLIGKDSNTHMHGLAVYVKEGLPFARDVSLANSADSYSLFQMALLHSVSYFLFLYQSPSLSLCIVFHYISSNVDEPLSINPSASVFVFGDFNVHHK